MKKHKLLLEKIINYKETAYESMTWREYINGMDNLIDEAIEELEKENTTTANSDVTQVRGNIDFNKIDYEIKDDGSLLVRGAKKD